MSRPGSFLQGAEVVPRGARVEYGLLGFQYTPEASAQVRIIGGTLTGTDEPWCGALGATTDDIYPGLPPEYVEGVLEALVEAQIQAAGVIVVVEAAHGLVGSSAGFFKRIAAAASSVLWATDADLRRTSTITALQRLLVG